MTNRAAVLHGAGDLRLEDRPVPTPTGREVLVEIRATGVCGSDVHYYEHGRIGRFRVTQPLVLGHETAGVVVATGPQATRHAVGSRVALEPGVPCGRCSECRAGAYNLCPEMAFLGTPPIDGAFTRFVTSHEDFAFALPDGMSDDAGALLEPLSVAIWACHKADVRPGRSVLVTGAGPIGLVAMQAARAFGSTDVTITDVNPARLRLAERTGATRAADVSREPLDASAVEADILLECSGHPTAIRDGLLCLRRRGTAVIVGIPATEEIPVPITRIRHRELTVTSTFRFANCYPAAIELARTGRVDLDAIVTGHFSLEETEAALQAARRDPTAVKPIVRPSA